MQRLLEHSRVQVLAIGLAIAAAFTCPARAERLAVKTYSMADGLPRNTVNCIRRDSHGFLWFCTDDGLSRFDGYTFTNYGTEQGLPDVHVSDFLESRSGEYWVATADGLCRFNPQPPPGASRAFVPGKQASRPVFDVFRPGPGDMERRITAIVQDLDGSVWCGTLGGLYRFMPASGHFEYIKVVTLRPPVENLHVDHGGTLWIALDCKFLRRWPDGRIEDYSTGAGFPGGERPRVSDFLEDASGRLWIGTWTGLCRLVPDPRPGRPVVERVYTTSDGLPDNHIESLFQSAEGTLWVTARGRLAEFVPGAEDRRTQPFRNYFNLGGALGEDADGNLWIGTSRWARNGFADYTVEDGLAGGAVFSIFEDRQGRLCVVTGDKWDRAGFISRLEGQRFVPVRPRMPAGVSRFTWGTGRIHFQDHTGTWWVATDQGLCRYPESRLEDLAHALPRAIYTKRDGLPGDGIFQLYEDSRGDIWISVVGPNVVTRWSRGDGTFHNYATTSEGKELGTPISFGEDRAGNVWMGFFWHNLARYRNGRFQIFTRADGLPAGIVRCIYSDHAGRLWLATTRGGLLRVDDPTADQVRFRAYTTAQGLSSNETWCITEDGWGQIYVGTGRGVDRLDPQSGRIHHFSAAAGLGFQNPPRVAFRDRRGELWFGESVLARLIPGPERPQSPPPIRIAHVRFRGTPYPVSELGETGVAGLTLAPDQNHVEIDFASLNFAPGEIIRYQYKLEHSDHDWSPLTDLRRVNYTNLPPGSYRFLVRAVNSEGITSPDPAWFTFVILRPLWSRWWFVTLAVLASGALVYAMFRYRLPMNSRQAKGTQGSSRRDVLRAMALAPIGVGLETTPPRNEDVPEGVRVIISDTLRQAPAALNTDWFGTVLLQGLLEWHKRGTADVRRFAESWLEHHVDSGTLQRLQRRPIEGGHCRRDPHYDLRRALRFGFPLLRDGHAVRVGQGAARLR